MSVVGEEEKQHFRNSMTSLQRHGDPSELLAYKSRGPSAGVGLRQFASISLTSSAMEWWRKPQVLSLESSNEDFE